MVENDNAELKSTRDKKELTSELLPEPGNPKVGTTVFKYLEQVVQFKEKQGLSAKMNRMYRLAQNDHWEQKSRKRVPLVTVNLLHTHKERTVSMLTDNNPTFNILPLGAVDENSEDIFDKLLKTGEHWWRDTEQQDIMDSAVDNGETYGVTIEKVMFNPDLEGGLGEVETELVDPFHFGWYPPKLQDIQKAEAVFHFYPLSVREVRRRWPDKAQRVVSDKRLIEELNDNRLEVTYNSSGADRGYLSSFAGVVKNVLNFSEQKEQESEETLVVECWVKDHSKTNGRDGNSYSQYPGNIRVVTVCNGGKVVLDDRPNPSINPELNIEQAAQTYLFDRFPFSKTVSIKNTVCPWGMTSFEQLEGLVVEINKSLSQFTLFKDRASRLKILNPKNSGVSNREFTNTSGIINPATDVVAQAIRYMDPPAIPSDIITALEVYKDLFFQVSGSFDMEQSRDKGSNAIAYKAIAALLERATMLLKRKIRNYSKMIRERGRMYLSHVMNWYTEERFISYEEDGEEMTMAIRGTDMIVPAKLQVVSGSTMPVSKIQEREEALELFRQGAIDHEALLKKIDWPDAKDVIKRMKTGPIGELMELLMLAGVPEPLTQYFSEIGTMDEKEVQSAIEKGELPPFELLIQQAFQPQEETGPTPIEQAEIQKLNAEVEKVLADMNLAREKANTERINQFVMMSGVQFDHEKLAIERARAISEIERAEKEVVRAEKEFGLRTVEAADRMDREQTREEFNQEKDARQQEFQQQHETRKQDSAEKTEKERMKMEKNKYAQEIQTKEAEQKGQGPYREKGLKSNNKKPGEKRK